MEFKVTDFAPSSAEDLPLSEEASYWPFQKNKLQKDLTKSERVEVLMLKDVYSLGVCILEMMIGRFKPNDFNLKFDEIPQTWGDLPESSALISVLQTCLNQNSISERKGKL
jgi:hypothetical protein